jgi:hypothetical protein
MGSLKGCKPKQRRRLIKKWAREDRLKKLGKGVVIGISLFLISSLVTILIVVLIDGFWAPLFSRM